MNTIGLAITATAALAILFGTARWALLSAVTGIFYLTLGQSVEIGGFTIYAFRILALVLFARVALRKELPSRLTSIDRYLLVAYLYLVIVFLLRARPNEGQAYQIGVAVDAFLWYFSFRSLLRNADDLRWMLGKLCIVLLPYAALVTMESLSAKNPFAAVGAADLARSGDMWFRGGRMRALGTFGNPSLLGTVAATFFALYLALWISGIGRLIGILGAAVCLAIVWASNSGGPLGCVGFALLGWATWPLRRSMRGVRISMLVSLIVIALSMNAPIWYLLAKLSAVTGGDGFHRAALLDVAFQNLDKWWLAGMPAADTARWLPYTNTTTGAVDMTNNFLVFGVASGLGAMALLIALIVQSFKLVGRALASARSRHLADAKSMELALWGIGVMLATHVFNWFAITYWDQSNLIWLLHIALVSSVCDQAIRSGDVNESRSEALVPTRLIASPSPITGRTWQAMLERSHKTLDRQKLPAKWN
jgi:hypothetical protein